MEVFPSIPVSLKYITETEEIVTFWQTFYSIKQEPSSDFEDILQSVRKALNEVGMSQEFCRITGGLPLRENNLEYEKTGRISHPH